VSLSEDDVAERAGTTPERVRELVALGVIGRRSDAMEPFSSGDALRIELVEELAASGVSPASIAAAMRSGALSLSYLDKFPGPSPRSDHTFEDICAELAIPFELLDRIYVGFGLPRPQPDATVREDDLDIVHGIPMLFAAGLGEAEVLRAARVWGDGPRRVAEHQVRSFHELLEEPYRREGLSDSEVLDRALTEVGVRIIPFCAKLVGWLYKRHFETYATQHRIEHIETALEHAGLHRKAMADPKASVFADLSGYTALTEELGDHAAAGMALRLAEHMQDVAERHGGRVVKMLGDGVFFLFDEPSRAVLGSLDFVEGAPSRGLPPAHVGVNAGPVTYTDGDYYGLSVIIAARIASAAGPGEVLVGEVVARRDTPEGVRFEEVGPVPLKGVARPVKVYRASRAAS